MELSKLDFYAQIPTCIFDQEQFRHAKMLNDIVCQNGELVKCVNRIVSEPA